MSMLLTNKQKGYLARLADRALNRQSALARGRGEVVELDWRARRDWRHDGVRRACGKAQLSVCEQGDFGSVEEFFNSAMSAMSAMSADGEAESGGNAMSDKEGGRSAGEIVVLNLHEDKWGGAKRVDLPAECAGESVLDWARRG